MNTKPLLQLLSDGAVHSGESLAEALGVSRTAVWKQVRKLLEKGIVVETIRGRGYQLAEPMDLMSESAIVEGLDESLRDEVSLRLYEQTDSTNSDIVRRWQQGETGLLVSIADCQEQGRGRRGRPWQSPRGQNLYMSVGMTIARGFTELDGLSLVAGLALVEALAGVGPAAPALKWPNDVLVEGRKLAGILIELQGELEGAVRVIIGIGLNVHMKEVDAVDQPWTSLALCAGEQRFQRDHLAGVILNRLVRRVDAFEQSGFSPFAGEWNRYDAFRGRRLVASSGGLYGVGMGVDSSGNYLLETDQGVEHVHAGEISLKVV